MIPQTTLINDIVNATSLDTSTGLEMSIKSLSIGLNYIASIYETINTTLTDIFTFTQYIASQNKMGDDDDNRDSFS